MPTSQQTPCYNLKAVVQQTGLKPDTLRAWERRYGLPKPQRSEGGHRLYSARDINIVKWLMARKREGLRIGQAVELWRQLETEGRDPLYTTPAPTATQVPTLTASQAAGSAMTELRERWLSACRAFDEQGAERVLSQAFALYPPETVGLELLQKGLSQIGKDWYRGELTVQQEHFASELAIRRLEALLMAAPPPTRPGRILTACPPEEEHAFSLLLLTFLLRRRGWEVLHLGANVPLEQAETVVEKAQPQLVILAAQQLHTAATLQQMAHLLQREGVPSAFGGRIFNQWPALRTRIPGHFLAERLEQAPQVVERLMTVPGSYSLPKRIPQAFSQAIDHYREHRPDIEAHLHRVLDAADIAPENLVETDADLARNIVAALTLGDINFSGADTDQVQSQLSRRCLPAGSLRDYLTAYYQAADKYLDERGRPIIDWLAKLTDQTGK